MKRKILSLIILCLVAALPALAQNKIITGRVIAAEDGLPIPSVSVRAPGTKSAAQTDAEGRFSLQVPSTSKTLEFSYLGYLTVRENIENNRVVNVSLKVDATGLEEVVVTGFGQTVKKRDITGAVSSISSKEIEKVPLVSFDRAMQGRLPGVRVNTNSGTPGSAVSVLIRGTGSFNASTAPLYIVDGIQVNSGDLSRSLSTSNVLSNLNPDDIETIDVLKDASSASIYGSQAANGVIIITTKRGKAGKTEFDFSSYFGYAEEVDRLDVLNGPEWLSVYTEEYINRYGANSAQVVGTSGIKTVFGADPALAPSYSWYDAAYRKGQTQNYQLTARGGDAKTKFFISAGLFNQKGQQIVQDFKRGTFKSNLEHNVNNKLSLEANISLSSFTQNGTLSGSTFANPSFGSNFLIPTQAIYTPSGDYNEPLLGAVPTNPIKSANYDINKGTTNQLQGIFALNYKIIDDLKFRATGSIDYGDIKEDRFQDPRTRDGAAPNGRYTFLSTEFKNYQTNATLNYNHLFGSKHKVSALAGFEYRHQVNNNVTTQKTGFPNYLFRTLNGGTVLASTSSSFTEFKNLGYFARAEYGFDDKYIINGTIRYDGNSRFGENQKFGLFGSGSLTWRVSRENFLKDVKWLSDWKIRTSYGKVGNSGIGNFASLSTFGSNSGYNGVGGISPGGLPNVELTWEDIYTLNLGTDVSLFNNRLSFTAEYYNKLNKNLLLTRTLPSTSGYGGVSDNAGKMRNRGFEFQINSENLVGRFKWSSSFNISYNKNKVLELITDDINPRFQLVGNSVTRILSYQYVGVNPADGRPLWLDANNNLTYNITVNDRQNIGDTQQKYFGGLTNNFSYEGIGLDIFFQYATGFLLFDQNKNFLDSYANASNRSTDVFRRWTTPGQITDVPLAYAGGNYVTGGIASTAYSTASTQWYKPGDYLRLKELRLSYKLPKNFISKAKLNNVLFYATGTNLLTWTKYTGIDPETVLSDNGGVPQARTYTVGFQIGL
ncbi:SusC/RagA family TonB-linked outer membrane protein [Pedobacter sp.]|uniref:SusC/RagA family TonB-linked outer membrane protein n=1 Tax=Pedobacter sp. TaxID=1411316 RepID=UPI003BA8C126